MEKVTKKIGEFMRSRDSTVASCFFFCNYVVSAEWGWFFFKCTDLKTVHFFQSLPIVSQQRARFEWLQSSNCEMGVARPTELATPIYFLCQAHELVAPKKWGLKTLSKQVCHHYLADFFFHASAHLFFLAADMRDTVVFFWCSCGGYKIFKAQFRQLS